ncbi:MAG: hypothetical protein H6Q66_1967 [Firmicutes bacterium]|nr:hypothetical protein [Bacillota bacterium]
MPALRISPEDLMERLKSETILIVDVRQDEPYENSKLKISGSVRLLPNDDEVINGFMQSTEKTQPIVTYCT